MKRTRELVADGLLVFGAGNLVVAGFLFSAMAGFTVMGLCACVLAYLIAPDEDSKGGGGQ